MLTPYRAIYLNDQPNLTDSAATALEQYVRSGGGLAWFLGDSVNPELYNTILLAGDRRLLPAPLDQIRPLPIGGTAKTGDVVFGDTDTLLDPLRSAGDASLAMIGLAKGWALDRSDTADRRGPIESGGAGDSPADEKQVRFRNVLNRRDGLPLVTEHGFGAGTVVTVLCGLDTDWTNWAGDPTFVPFMLLSNARLWSGASAPTGRTVTEPLVQTLSTREYFPELKLLTPAQAPPRVMMELTGVAESVEGESNEIVRVELNPVERLIAGESNVDDLLRPGLFEWGLLKADGGSRVIPTATTIVGGEGELARADAAEIRRALLPIEVQFVSSSDWRQQNEFAGSSSLGMMLLALLGLLLAAEQAFAYWASYHARSDASSTGMLQSEASAGRTRHAFGLGGSAKVGRQA
jgi:hypothetical protein